MGSCSSATSFSDALPIVVRSASSENRQLFAPDMTSICGCTGQAYDLGPPSQPPGALQGCDALIRMPSHDIAAGWWLHPGYLTLVSGFSKPKSPGFPSRRSRVRSPSPASSSRRNLHEFAAYLACFGEKRSKRPKVKGLGD